MEEEDSSRDFGVFFVNDATTNVEQRAMHTVPPQISISISFIVVSHDEIKNISLKQVSSWSDYFWNLEARVC